MKKIATTLLMTAIVMFNLQAQKYFTKTGEISFHSSTSIENIEAVSHSALTVYDSATGKIQWAVLIKSFEFEKALMQEHFNENYMESSKYPKANFKGSIKDFESLDLLKDGTYKVSVIGILEIHGVSKEIETKATWKVESGLISTNCDFTVFVADYDIKIPSVVRDNIDREILIKINANYAILEKS